MSLCGTLDLKRNYIDFGTLFDGEESFYIGEAGQWFLARLNDFEMSPPMPDPTAGTYDFYVREAVSLMSIYLCADGYLRRETAIEEDNWWEPYRTRAEDVIDRLRSGDYKLSYQTSIWEHGISPCIPTLNGTITAPPAGVCTSNHGYAGVAYTGETARTVTIELDGDSGTIQSQTYKWKWDSSTDWEAETVACSSPDWNSIGYGLHVFFNNPTTGTLEAGMQWKVRLNPTDEIVSSAGITSGMRNYG